FQAEDGIRIRNVTGVQTCALPISGAAVDVLLRPGHDEAQGVLRPSRGAPMTEYREADFTRLKTVSIAQRPNKVDPSLLAHPPGRSEERRVGRGVVGMG